MASRSAGTYRSDSLRPTSGTYLFAALVVILSLGLALVWSHYKLFWVDELLEFYSDTRPSAAAVIAGQLHSPFSLEPPSFHLLLHFLDRVFAAHPELGGRLLSLLSLPVAEICIFRVSLRLTGHRNTALVAMALPFLLVTVDYAPEARVYSLLTALFALAILSYQAAIDDAGGMRRLALAGLFASLSAAILVHYYGLLFPLPVLAGELVRTARRRRVDWPVLLAIAGPFAMFAFNLPFLKPLHEIQSNYDNTGETHATMIPFTYLWFFWHFNPYYFVEVLNHRILTFCYRVLWYYVFAFAVSVCLVVWRSRRGGSILPVFVVVLAGFLLPVVNVAVAHYVTHAYVPRYSLPAVISICILLGLLFDRPLQHPLVFAAVFSSVLAVSCIYALHHIRLQRTRTQITRADLAVTPALLAELGAQPDHHVYVQDVPHFLAARFYLPREFAPAIVGVGSAQRELYWMHRDTSSLFVRNIGLSTALQVVRYETVKRTPGPHLFVVYDDPEEDWMGRELACLGLLGAPLGSALGGTLYRVNFPEDGTREFSRACSQAL